MSIDTVSEAQQEDGEAFTVSSSRSAPVLLRPIHLAFAALILIGSIGVTAAIASRSTGEMDRTAASDLAKVHAADKQKLEERLTDKDREIERLSSRLKESYEKQKRLIARASDLEARVKAFQGTLSLSRGSLLPSKESVIPVSVSPVFTSGETPFIKDGSRWLAVRKEGIFVASAAPRELRDAFAGRSLRLSEAAKALATKAKPPAGSVLMLAPDREFTDVSRPIFKWKRQPGMIGSVQCAILDKDGRTLALSDLLSADSWQPTNPLPRGHSYTWRILSPNPVEPDKAQVLAETTFSLLSEAESAQLNKNLSEAGGSLLLRMAAYLEAGVYASAESEAQKFSEANPGLKDGQRLLQQMRALKPKRADDD